MNKRTTKAEGFEGRRTSFVDALAALLNADERIQAAWLEGSLGRGAADRYSDVDLHVLLEEDALPAFKASAESWLSALRPLVLFNSLFGGAMLNALTDDGLRIDVWPHGGKSATIENGRAHVLVERPGALVRVEPSSPQPDATARHLLQQTREFWRCIALLPSVLGRGERIVAVQGLAVEVGLVTDLLVVGAGRTRDRGVKHLNAFLDEEARREVEAALVLPDLAPQTLANAHLRLVALVRRRAPEIATAFGFSYPTVLEEAALTYTLGELQALGIKAHTLPTD